MLERKHCKIKEQINLSEERTKRKENKIEEI